MIKKLILVVTSIILILGLFGCAQPNQSQYNDGYLQGVEDGFNAALKVWPANVPKPLLETSTDTYSQNSYTTPRSTTTIKPTTNSVTVYITNTGSKYHRSGCRYLSKSKIPISLSDAISRGYGACSVCNP